MNGFLERLQKDASVSMQTVAESQQENADMEQADSFSQLTRMVHHSETENENATTVTSPVMTQPIEEETAKEEEQFDNEPPVSTAVPVVPMHVAVEEVSETAVLPASEVPSPVAIYESIETGMLQMDNVPPFQVLDTEDQDVSYRGDWSPSMKVTSYIGDQKLLLEYLAAQERKYRVTMPIQACGIDPIIFDKENLMGNSAIPADKMSSGTHNMFYLTTPSDDSNVPPVYELIEVDGDKYLSCVTKSLDEEYLRSVIAEATTSLFTYGKYFYRMVCYRKLSAKEGYNTGSLLKTLRLNTFEMSSLINYMQEFDGVSVHFATINGRQHIIFSRED